MRFQLIGRDGLAPPTENHRSRPGPKPTRTWPALSPVTSRVATGPSRGEWGMAVGVTVGSICRPWQRAREPEDGSRQNFLSDRRPQPPHLRQFFWGGPLMQRHAHGSGDWFLSTEDPSEIPYNRTYAARHTPIYPNHRKM